MNEMSNHEDPDPSVDPSSLPAYKSVQDQLGELKLLTDLAAFELGVAGNESIIDFPAVDANALIPGCADLQMAMIKRIGYRGNFPMPKEWENLLSMLEPGNELLWIIAKRPDTGFHFYVGMKAAGSPQRHSEKTRELRDGFQSLIGQLTKRSFPESIAEEKDQDSVIQILDGILNHSNGEVVVTSGLPSPALIEENREFPEHNPQATPDGSLNDIVEPFSGEHAFSIIFTVGRADTQVANDLLTGMTDFRTTIAPFLKIQQGMNTAVTEAEARGTQTTHGTTLGQTEARNMLSARIQGLFGSRAGAIRKISAAEPGTMEAGHLIEAMLKSRKAGVKGSWWKGSPMTIQKSSTEAITETHTDTFQTGESTTTTHTNAMLELVDQKLQDSIRSLKKAAGTGAFFMAAEVFSPKTELSLRIARSISGSLSGSKTHLRPFQTAVYRGSGFGDHMLTNSTIDDLYPAITVQSRHVAALFLPVPEADLPGLRTKRNVFYGKPNATQRIHQDSEMEKAPGTVWLGDLAHLRSAPISSADREFQIPAQDLTSHLLIAGTTGSGKTQRAASILNRLSTSKFQVVVIESAKKTYRRLLRRNGVLTRILALGEQGDRALRINPFFFEPGTSLKRHISILSDALADLLPVEALIGPKLREAIQRCYLRYEWDIEKGRNQGKGEPAYPTMVDLHMEVMAVAKALNYGPELNSNYKGALLGRTRLFIDELYQDIFGWGGSVPLEQLFGDDDVIIEMDSLPPSEAKMPSFVLSILLERMRSWQHLARQNRDASRRDIVLVIEEAHNLLEKNLEGQQSEREMGSGRFLLKQIVRLLQEGRDAGLGVIVVDQSPASLADAVVRNTNTKIILRITDSEEAERIGSTLGLTKEECRDLHELDDGEAVVKVKNAGRALKLSPSDIVEEKEPAGGSSDRSISSPDYYLATKTIFKILDLLKSPASTSIEERVQRLVNDVAKSAGANDEAKRFFCQKLVAAVSETMDTDLLETDRMWLDFSSLPLLICRMAACASFKSFHLQVQDLCSHKSWTDVRPAFDGTVIPVLPFVEMHLASDLHWSVGAATEFVRLLKILNEPAANGIILEESYSKLRILTLASTERFESIRSLILYYSH